jgi:hypothetical protein
MQTFTHSGFHASHLDTASATAQEAGTDMERLALALLQAAQCFEIEAGLLIRVTPVLSLEALASLAGIEAGSAALLLDYMLEAGFVSKRPQRFVLSAPEALYKLALGAAAF